MEIGLNTPKLQNRLVFSTSSRQIKNYLRGTSFVKLDTTEERVIMNCLQTNRKYFLRQSSVRMPLDSCTIEEKVIDYKSECNLSYMH